jgi:hypothetical protein
MTHGGLRQGAPGTAQRLPPAGCPRAPLARRGRALRRTLDPCLPASAPRHPPGEYTAARDQYARSAALEGLDNRRSLRPGSGQQLAGGRLRRRLAQDGDTGEAEDFPATAAGPAGGAADEAAPFYMVVGFEVSPCSIARKAGVDVEDIVCGMGGDEHITPQASAGMERRVPDEGLSGAAQCRA